MRKPQASTAMALLLAAGAAGGCSAHTNTLDLDSGRKPYTFRHAEIDEITTVDGRAFAVLPRTEQTAISVQGQVVREDAILPYVLVPRDNSILRRTPGEVKVVPKDERYVLVNASCPRPQGGLEVNTCPQPFKAFFVLDKIQLPNSVEPDEYGVIQEREFKRAVEKRGYVEIGGKKYLKVDMRNPLGGPDVALIDARHIDPVYQEERTRACGNLDIISGVEGFGYFPVPERNVTSPSTLNAEVRPLTSSR